jgi:predicted kinase
MGEPCVIKLMDLLTEGVHDKGIFKAVFMAGGPGSGKSYIASQIFGIPEEAGTNVGVDGLKSVNTDTEFVFLLKKYGFNPKFLDQYPEGQFDQPGGLRDLAKDLTKARKQGYLDGKLGMIIDGTGSKFQKIKKQKKRLEEEGYDCYMVFVETSLEVAQKRNTERSRVLDPKIVEKSWKDTRKNLGAFKSIFKGNFALVNNDNYVNAKQAKHKFGSIVKKYASKWANSPIKNPIGRKWVEDQMKLKKMGVKK